MSTMKCVSSNALRCAHIKEDERETQTNAFSVCLKLAGFCVPLWALGCLASPIMQNVFADNNFCVASMLCHAAVIPQKLQCNNSNNNTDNTDKKDKTKKDGLAPNICTARIKHCSRLSIVVNARVILMDKMAWAKCLVSAWAPIVHSFHLNMLYSAEEVVGHAG